MNLRREATNALWVLGTVAVGVLAVLALVHFIRVRRAFDEHAGELARTVHAMKETRSF
jgi:hypothetical protein